MTDQRARAIQRYELEAAIGTGMTPNDDGDWVSYEDHVAALADERRRGMEALREVVEGLKNIESHCDRIAVLSKCSGSIKEAQMAQVGAQRLLASLGEVGELDITHDPHPGKFQASEDLPGSY